MTTVLIVDDDVNFAGTLAKVLSKKGYGVTIAASGLRALELIKDKAYDVVLMDIKMPVMNGVETFKNIKILRPGTVVIMMTAFSADNLIAEALKEGAYAVVRKPFDMDGLINMIEKTKDGILIVVVDDDPEICKTMKDILQKKGYSTSTCATGEEAVALTRERKYDILFIDIKLPVLNGLETYLEVKKVNPQAVAIMMTAFRQETDEMVREAIEKGAYTCFYKPFDMEKVIQAVEDIQKKITKE